MTTPGSAQTMAVPPRTITPSGTGASNAAINTQAELVEGSIPASLVAAANSTAVAYRYLIAYTFIILLLALLNRTKVGHVVVYYSLLLMVVFVLVTQSGWVTWLLSPITGGNVKIEKSTVNIQESSFNGMTPGADRGRR